MSYRPVSPRTSHVVRDVFSQVLGEDATALPILDIHQKWQDVAVDAVAAVFCTVPGFNVPASGYFLWRYSFKQRRFMITEQWWSLLQETYLWLAVIFAAYLRIRNCWAYYDLASENSLALAAEALQATMISDACWVGAVLLWRILQVHIIQIGAHVYWHKDQNRDALKDNAKALHLLSQLENQFPQYFKPNYKAHCNAGDIEAEMKRAMSHATALECFVIYLSSVCMLLGMLYLQSRTEEAVTLAACEARSACGSLWPVTILGKTMRLSLVSLAHICFVVYLSVQHWYVFLCGILFTTKRFEDNTNQLLLFTALSEQAQVDMWSAANRRNLKQILLAGANDSNEIKLKERIREQMEAESLDLTKTQDIQAWWKLRKYIQVDFVDESAIMDFCAAVTFILFLSLFFCGALDWVLNQDPLSPGLALMFLLVSALSFAMLRVFQVCVNINLLLERDARVLADAAVDALTRQGDALQQQEVATLLLALQRKVEAFDDQQGLFGLKITRNMRNSWAAANFLVMFFSAYQIFRPSMEQLQLSEVGGQLSNFTASFTMV